jgi:peroxiredoxin
MGAWGREQGAAGKVRMLADGSADFARAADLVLDLSAKGLGVRSQRYSAYVVDGEVRLLNLEGGGGYAVSDAATLLAQIRAL